MVPPRYKWLKRLCAGAAVSLLLLIVLRVWWGHYANRKLEQTIAAIRQKGEPLLLQDFDPPGIPQDQNAAWLLMQAEGALSMTAAQTTLVAERHGAPDLTEDDWRQLQLVWEANQESLSLIRQARSLQQADWLVRVRSPAVNVVLPGLAGQRALVRMAAALLRYHHWQGNHREAVELVRDILAAGDAMDQMPFLIAYLVARAERNLGYDAIERIAPTLRVSPSGSEREPWATREQVIALITELLDEQKVQAAVVRAMHGERAFQLDCIQVVMQQPGSLAGLGVAAGPPAVGFGPLAVLLRPMIKLDGVYMMEHMNLVVAAVAEPNYPHAIQRMPSFSRLSGLKSMARAMSQALLPAFEHSLRLHYEELALRRMAALALAIRLYELDHDGRPETLTELVPVYLETIPEDPFAADGRAIAYLPQAQPPLLYSVSVNGRDEGGRYTTSSHNEVEWQKHDLPFFLDGERPRPTSVVPPTAGPAPSQAGEDDQNVKEDQRQADQDQDGEQ